MGKVGGLSVRWLAVAVATVLLSTFAVFGSASPASASGEGTILSLVNQARAANGLGPLRLNSAISAVSAAWADQMAANGVMTHNPSYASQMPSGWSRAAENVAMGYSTPTAVHEGWMNSSGHRANILGDFTDIGIAFLTANGTTWAVENFGKYGASAPPPAAPAPPAPPAPAPPAPAPPSPAQPAAPPPAASASPSPAPPSEREGPSPALAETAVPPVPDVSPPPPGPSESPRAGNQKAVPFGATDPAADGPFEEATGAVGGALAAVVAATGMLTLLLLRRRWGGRGGSVRIGRTRV